MYGSLLMANQYMIDTAHGMQGIVNIEDRAPGVAEYLLDALIDKRPDDHFGAR
ncbi:hypothetical protein D3C76_1691760 [compost metagenome]